MSATRTAPTESGTTPQRTAPDTALRRPASRWALLLSPRWISRAVLVVGVVSLIAALSPSFHRRTEHVHHLVTSLFWAAGSTGIAAISIVLIVLSRGLRRGKHRAWSLAAVLAATAGVLHFVRGPRPVAGALCCLFALVLIAARANFTARPDPRSLTRVAQILVFGTVAATGLGWVWLTLHTRGEAAGTTAWQRLAESVLGLAGIPGPVDYVQGNAQAHAAVGLLMLGAVIVISAVMAALQPADGPHYATPAEEGDVRALLAKWGWVDSLSYFATRRDRSVIFSPCGQAAISYRVIGSTSLSAGDPIGNPAAWPGAVEAWLAEAKSYGWTPANLGASERGATIYTRAGMDCLELGDEAILHVDGWSLEGRAMRGVRQAVSRTTRAGLCAHVSRMSELDPAIRARLLECAVAWRDSPVERGFSMALGRFGDPSDDSVVVWAQNGEGELVGLLNFVWWGDDGLSLDLMRRSRGSENGIIELMVTTLMQQAPEHGITQISLNFAVFRGAFAQGERLGAGPVQRAWRALLLSLSRLYSFEALYRSNAKYGPEWRPRFACYASITDAARVGTAILRAEALLTMPAWWENIAARRRQLLTPGNPGASDTVGAGGTSAKRAAAEHRVDCAQSR